MQARPSLAPSAPPQAEALQTPPSVDDLPILLNLLRKRALDVRMDVADINYIRIVLPLARTSRTGRHESTSAHCRKTYLRDVLRCQARWYVLGAFDGALQHSQLRSRLCYSFSRPRPRVHQPWQTGKSRERPPRRYQSGETR